MGYRHWPPDPSDPPRHDPDGATASGYGPDGWSAWHSRGEEEGTNHPGYGYQGETGYWPAATPPPGQPRDPEPPPPAHQWYGYGADPYATQVYPAVPPVPRSQRQRPATPPPATPAPAADTAWPPLAWTTAFFVVPVLLYLLWAAMRSGAVPANCIDASGAPCPSPRAGAIASLAGALPGLAGAFALALAAAVALRRIASNWRASTVAFAAGVIGAGAATLIASVLG